MENEEILESFLKLSIANAIEAVRCPTFDYTLLIGFFRYSNLRVKSLIKYTLLKKISNKELDYGALIIEYGEFRSNRLGIEALMKELFEAVPKEELDFENLIQLFKTDSTSPNIGYSNTRKNVLIAEILLKKFPDGLDYETLINFSKLNDNNVRNLLENILSENFPNQLKKQLRIFMDNYSQEN